MIMNLLIGSSTLVVKLALACSKYHYWIQLIDRYKAVLTQLQFSIAVLHSLRGCAVWHFQLHILTCGSLEVGKVVNFNYF